MAYDGASDVPEVLQRCSPYGVETVVGIRGVEMQVRVEMVVGPGLGALLLQLGTGA